ncbi:MAG: nuclease-related domain-containing protein [Anaerosomatales bacterium]|nr:nuclease-related domain-containing protein [Anaerosomatales bacterium]
MALFSVCEDQPRHPESRETDALRDLAHALGDTDALVIAGHTFRAIVPERYGLPPRLYTNQADFVVLHPARGIVVVELKAPRSKAFFDDVFEVETYAGELVSTTRAIQAMRQAVRAAKTVMNELAEHVPALDERLPRRFDPSLVRPKDWHRMSNALTAVVAIYPRLPEGIEPDEGVYGITCIGFDELLEFLTPHEEPVIPYFYPPELEALAALLELRVEKPEDVLARFGKKSGDLRHRQPVALV